MVFSQLCFLISMLYSHLRNRYRLKFRLFLALVLILRLYFNVFIKLRQCGLASHSYKTCVLGFNRKVRKVFFYLFYTIAKFANLIIDKALRTLRLLHVIWDKKTLRTLRLIPLVYKQKKTAQ